MPMKERKILLYAHISAAVDNAHHCEKKVKNTSSEVTGEKKISVEGLKIILVKSITRPVFFCCFRPSLFLFYFFHQRVDNSEQSSESERIQW